MLAILYTSGLSIRRVCWSMRDVKSKYYCRTQEPHRRTIYFILNILYVVLYIEPHSRTIYFILNILYCILNHAVEWAFTRLCLLENHLRCTLSFYSNGSLQNQQKQESLEKSLHVTTLYELWWSNLWSDCFCNDSPVSHFHLLRFNFPSSLVLVLGT